MDIIQYFGYYTQKFFIFIGRPDLCVQRNKGFYFFKGNTLLVPQETKDNEIQIPVAQERLLSVAEDTFSIPPLEGKDVIKAVMLNNEEAITGWKEIPMRQALSIITGSNMAKGEGDLGRLLRAYHIGQWRRGSRYCGSCGAQNNDADTELARLCPACGRLEFPRIAPAVITIIINDRDEALLAHNKKFTPRVYSLVAGFNEAGESLEATVAREIREEVSLEVRDIRYIISQPWPFPDSLMLGFCCRHAGGEIKVDNIEIEDAQWFPKDKLPTIPGSGSVSRYLIELWLEGVLPLNS